MSVCPCSQETEFTSLIGEQRFTLSIPPVCLFARASRNGVTCSGARKPVLSLSNSVQTERIRSFSDSFTSMGLCWHTSVTTFYGAFMDGVFMMDSSGIFVPRFGVAMGCVRTLCKDVIRLYFLFLEGILYVHNDTTLLNTFQGWLQSVSVYSLSNWQLVLLSGTSRFFSSSCPTPQWLLTFGPSCLLANYSWTCAIACNWLS